MGEAHGSQAFEEAGCFEEQLDALNAALVRAIAVDGRVVLPGTRIGGCEVLRACTVNHRTTRADVETLFAVVRELAHGVAPDTARPVDPVA